jgi:phage-related protein
MTNDPDQIREDIYQTQRELSADVDALSEKLSPPRIVERRVRRTRASMTNMKDKIMGSTASGASSTRDTVSSTASSARDAMSSTASSAAGTLSSVPDTVRRRTEGNPLAVGVIAFGAGWLVSSLLPVTSAEQQVATQVKDAAAEHARPVADQLGEAAQQAKEQLREPVRQAADSVKSAASGAASTVSEETQSAAGDVAGRTQQAKDTVTDQTGSPGR